MGRTVIIGDVHGCRREVEDLLGAVRFSAANDHLVLVGDLVVRGPDARGTLALVRALGGRSVRGNHEQRLLDGRAGARIGTQHQRVAAELGEEDWRSIEAMPLWLDLPEHGVRVAHAGVVPGMAVESMPPEALLTIRTIDGRHRWSDKRDTGVVWGTKYTGPPHVVFGHNAGSEPQLHPWATGLDTGCVYGGRLTALVLDEAEPVPRGESVRSKLVSVPAERSYFEGEAP
jgi:hypothetical protein